MKTIVSPALAGVLLIGGVMGCASNVKQVHASLKVENPVHVYVDDSQMGSVDVAMAQQGYDGAQLANTLHSSTMNAGATTPGYSPAAGLAGALIGGVLAANMADSAAQKQKNEPVESWLQVLEGVDWEPLIVSTIDDLVEGEVTVSAEESNPDGGNVMHIQPRLEVVSNYMSLEMHSLVEVFNRDGDKVYSNYFHVQSPALYDQSMILSDINNKTAADAEALVVPLVQKTARLVYEEFRIAQVKSAPKSIRFENHMGKYYERGRLVKTENGYITFKTLRGEVKHYPINQEPEASEEG